MYKQNDRETPDKEFVDKVVQVKRVSKKTKGGNQISFTALVVSGDQKGRVGVALGKAKNVSDAIKKAAGKSKKDMTRVPLIDGTIPHEIRLKFKSGLVFLKPGRKGSGIIAGGPVRTVVEAAGVKDITSKIIGSKNKAINVWTTLKALKTLTK